MTPPWPTHFPAPATSASARPRRPNLLTIDTGSGNSTLALARISGKSPAWVFGSPNTGYCGGEAFIGLVTTAGDYVASAPVGDSFFFHLSNAGRMLIGRTSGNGPVMAVHNASANVAVGLGVDTPGGRFVAARPITVGTGTVELQGNNASVGAHALSLGYRGPYNTRDMLEAAYVQVEWQGNSLRPLLLQPLGGSVMIGHQAPTGAPDPSESTSVPPPQAHRFHVAQHINSGSAVMADLHLTAPRRAAIPVPVDSQRGNLQPAARPCALLKRTSCGPLAVELLEPGRSRSVFTQTSPAM